MMLQFGASPRLDTAHVAAFPTAMGSKLSLVRPFLLFGPGNARATGQEMEPVDKRERQLAQGTGTELRNRRNRVQHMTANIHTE